MNATQDFVRLPSTEESVAPVKILDANGHVVRVVSATEFREMHPSFASSRFRPTVGRRPRRPRSSAGPTPPFVGATARSRTPSQR